MALYAAAGLPVFPVDARGKRPLVTGWQNATAGRALKWAEKSGLAAADGIGVVMGVTSGITEVDVDAAGDAWLGVAIERFGDTPIIIRTASGKAKLWYRHSGEGRRVRPFSGLPVDVLGAGFTIAPPSLRVDLGQSYAFVAGGLNDLPCLPVIRSGQVPDMVARAPEAVLRGDRNASLWRHCMAQARSCDDVEALIDVALTWSGALPEPLGSAEAERCARSAWNYETLGRNFLGLRKPQLTGGDRIMDDLIDQPEAYALYQMFLRWHGRRPSFAVAPTAMSKAGSPPWHRTRIARARDVLLERGFITEVVPPRRGGNAGQYRLAEQMPDSGKDHNTPPPLGPDMMGNCIQQGNVITILKAGRQPAQRGIMLRPLGGSAAGPSGGVG